MFEQIKHNMETIAGVAIYPILSLLIFFFLRRIGDLGLSYKRTDRRVEPNAIKR
jgi:hypothetical protein